MAIKSKKTTLRVRVTNIGKIRIPNTFFVVEKIFEIVRFRWQFNNQTGLKETGFVNVV
jgi:hypothetical protein